MSDNKDVITKKVPVPDKLRLKTMLFNIIFLPLRAFFPNYRFYGNIQTKST